MVATVREFLVILYPASCTLFCKMYTAWLSELYFTEALDHTMHLTWRWGREGVAVLVVVSVGRGVRHSASDGWVASLNVVSLS